MSATVYLETIGCQMNVADSERAIVRLRAAGFGFADSSESADVVIFNTCSVRERAAHKVFTRIGEVRRQRLHREPVVGVMGCVAQLEGSTLFDNSPSVNLIVGTRATDRLPELIGRALEGESRVIDLDERAEGEKWDVPASARRNTSRSFRSSKVATSSAPIASCRFPEGEKKAAARPRSFLRLTSCATLVIARFI